MINKGDFVELSYIGKLKGTDAIFDLTDEAKAKEIGMFNPNVEYGPVTICVGEKNLIPGIDNELIGKDIGKFVFDVMSKDAFGPKNPKLLKIIKKEVFLKQNINPFVGLQINVDGAIGVVRSLSSGRSIVDFNHPLAGRDVTYEVEILKIVQDNIEKLKSILKFSLFLDSSLYLIEKKENLIDIKTKIEIPNEVTFLVIEKYNKLVSKDDKIKFIFEKQDTTTKE